MLPGVKLTHEVRPHSGKLHGCVVISQTSLNYNGLDAVFQRMRKFQEIATSLSLLAMTITFKAARHEAISQFSGLSMIAARRCRGSQCRLSGTAVGLTPYYFF
jgi:hypothetical protein